MAFEKKPLNYDELEEIVEYSIGLENRIEDGIAEFLNTASISGAWLTGQGRFTDKKTGLMVQWRQAEVTLASGVDKA